MKSLVWIVLVSVLTIICLLLIWRIMEDRKELAAAEDNALSMREQMGDLHREVIAARKQALKWHGEMLKVASPTLREIYGWPAGLQFPYVMQERLVKQGFSDPAAEILADLRKHPELIPYPGIQGSNMFFGRSKMVGVERVIADFEDGHYGGWALMAFEVKDSREIDWRLVYARADGREPVYGEGLQPQDTVQVFIP